MTIKKIAYQLAALSCMSTLMGLAQANVNNQDTLVNDDVIFVTIPDVGDIACVSGTDGTPTTRTATFTLQNNQPAALALPSFQLNTTDAFTESLIQHNLIEIDFSTGCPDAGQIPGFLSFLGNQCDINIDITQPTCDNESGPMLDDIFFTLDVGVRSQQLTLSSDIDFSLTTLGSAADFAVFSTVGVSNSPGDGIAQLVGNLGYGKLTGNFNIIDGASYTTSDYEFTNAWNDTLATQQVFLDNLGGCSAAGNPGSPGYTEFTPDYYCLSNAGNDVVVSGPITLNGTGNFVFFVDADGVTTSCDGDSSYCGLVFNPTTSFIYLNGASQDSVFWVVGSNGNGGDITLQTNAIIDGTIISGGGEIIAATSGTYPAIVNGRILSPNDGGIFLNSNAVAIHQ